MAQKAIARFRGRILPEFAEVTINFTPTIHWKATEQGYEVDIICRVDKSIVDIECILSDWKIEHFADLYRRALDVCRAKIDLVGFKMAYGLTVLLDTFEAPGGAVTHIALNDANLEGICTAFSLDRGFDEVCMQVLQRPLLFMAVRELMTAVTLPHVAPVECARAMDRIKNLLATPGSKDKAAWKRMRETLRVDEMYLKYISTASADPRHGQPGYTSGSVTMEATRRAWVIMNRYLEYLVQGENPLDPAAYPILDR